jgi:hypothetical protein
MRYRIAFEISKNPRKKGDKFETFHVDKIEISDRATARAVANGVSEIFKEVRGIVDKNPCEPTQDQVKPQEREE